MNFLKGKFNKEEFEKSKPKIRIMPLLVVAAICFALGTSYAYDKENKINEQIRSQYATMTIEKDKNGQDVKTYKLKNPSTQNTDKQTVEEVEQPTEKVTENQVEHFEQPKEENVQQQKEQNIEQPIKETDTHDKNPMPTNQTEQNTVQPGDDPNFVESINPETATVNNSNNLVVGGIPLGVSYDQAFKKYEKYYMYDGRMNEVYFNNDKNGYGDFLLTITKDGDQNVISMSYNRFSINPNAKNLPVINIGNIQPGSSIEQVKQVYGDWDRLIEQNDVKVIYYYDFSYNGRPVLLTFYIDRPTQTVFGYEVSFI